MLFFLFVLCGKRSHYLNIALFVGWVERSDTHAATYRMPR